VPTPRRQGGSHSDRHRGRRRRCAPRVGACCPCGPTIRKNASSCGSASGGTGANSPPYGLRSTAGPAVGVNFLRLRTISRPLPSSDTSRSRLWSSSTRCTMRIVSDCPLVVCVKRPK
jgi:hypothetical protein